MLFSVNNSWKCRGLAREHYINPVIWTHRHSSVLLRKYPLGAVAQISGLSSPGRQSFVLWRLIFVGSWIWTRFVSPVWRL